MTFDDLIELFAKQRGEDECYEEAYECLPQAVVERVGRGGRQKARTALSIWQLREHTTWVAGTDRSGFEITLRNLAALPPEQEVLSWGFYCNNRAYVVFAIENETSRGEIVGCIRVNLRQ